MMKTITVKDLGEVITGNTPPRSKPELYGDYTPFIKATDISETSKYTYEPEECYSEEGYKKYRNSLIPKGATCVVTIGSVGKKMTMAHCDCFINQAMNAIIPNENYDKEYVYYLLKHNVHKLKMLNSGTASGRENVSKSAFSNMELLAVQDIVIQKKIGSILADFDKLIENNQKQINLLEEAAQRLYKEWFVDLRFPGYEETEIVDCVPEGWNVINGKELYEIKTGKKDANQAVENGIYSFFTCSRDDGLFTNEYVYDGKAIIISGNGSYTGFVKRYNGKFDAYQRTYYLSGFKDYMWTFLYCNFKSVFEKNYMGGTKGSAIPYITKPDLENYKILVPNESYIKEFDMLVSKIFSKVEILVQECEFLKQARDRILPKLMNGEIEV